jgi:hypothetical protein
MANVDRCEPYVCDAAGCKTSCAADEDCYTGNVCSGSKCVPQSAGNKCSTDHASSITAKGTVACAPYLCDDATGQCFAVCGSDADCAAGQQCTPSRTCVPAAGGGDTGSSGGCDVGGSSAPAAWSALGVLAMLGLSRRKTR